MNDDEFLERQIQSVRICHLFRAVLKQALDDAFGVRCRKSKRKKIKENARAFFENSDDFRMVCQMAFVRPEAILDVALKVKLKNEEKYKQILLIIKENYYNF